jgi:MoaA/NifB/PqqE/SkfB family radical SAM enzyme
MMVNAVELCWQITSECNENCKFCHFFRDKFEILSVDENNKILENIFELKIPAITWTGGEALLYKGLKELIHKAYLKGIKNRLITNGQLCENEIFLYLDELIISIDSTNPDVNILLGRGENHFNNILNTIKEIRAKHPLFPPIRINTMISKINKSCLSHIYDFIDKNNIFKWRISKFTPLRGKAKENSDLFSVLDSDFDIIIKEIKECNLKNQLVIETRKNMDFEHNYFLIVPNGNMVVTKHNEDIILGNARDIDIFRKNTNNINWLV